MTLRATAIIKIIRKDRDVITGITLRMEKVTAASGVDQILPAMKNEPSAETTKRYTGAMTVAINMKNKTLCSEGAFAARRKFLLMAATKKPSNINATAI